VGRLEVVTGVGNPDVWVSRLVESDAGLVGRRGVEEQPDGIVHAEDSSLLELEDRGRGELLRYRPEREDGLGRVLEPLIPHGQAVAGVQDDLVSDADQAGAREAKRRDPLEVPVDAH
jgi:hypothetical protein